MVLDQERLFTANLLRFHLFKHLLRDYGFLLHNLGHYDFFDETRLPLSLVNVSVSEWVAAIGIDEPILLLEGAQHELLQ